MWKLKNEGIPVLNIFYEDSANTRLISIMSTLHKREEREYLQYLVKDTGERKIEVFIYEANIIHGYALKMLCEYCASIKIKVHVQKKTLHSYLLRCGIPSLLISRGSIQKEMNVPITQTIDAKDSAEQKIDSVTSEMEFTDELVDRFTEVVYSKYGFDFREYQKNSLKRRLQIFIRKGRIQDFHHIYEEVLENRENFENLMIDFPIRTTEFFRDSNVFKIIRNKILPYLDSYPSIKIWCSGCSTGEEPYSLAILLGEAGMLDKTHIYATDLNPNVVEEARNGMYGIETIQKGSENYTNSGGKNHFNDYFDIIGKCARIKHQYRNRILFFQHSLTNTGILNEFQLILCRNVLMYFNNSLQNKVLKLFNNSMDLSAFLLLGKSEGIQNNDGKDIFFAYDRENRIYRKKEILTGKENWLL
jgi:chemotaxis protein methyltransferase CheR